MPLDSSTEILVADALLRARDRMQPCCASRIRPCKFRIPPLQIGTHQRPRRRDLFAFQLDEILRGGGGGGRGVLVICGGPGTGRARHGVGDGCESAAIVVDALSCVEGLLLDEGVDEEGAGAEEGGGGGVGQVEAEGVADVQGVVFLVEEDVVGDEALDGVVKGGVGLLVAGF